jgi:hypothetical protein
MHFPKPDRTNQAAEVGGGSPPHSITANHVLRYVVHLLKAVYANNEDVSQLLYMIAAKQRSLCSYI